MGRMGLVLLGLVLGALVLAGCALAGRLPGFGQGCPPASEWRVVEGNPLGKLEPACARSSLEKALAFYLARAVGYTPREAAERLGPVRHAPVGEVSVPWIDGERRLPLRGPAGFGREDFLAWHSGPEWVVPVGCVPHWNGYTVACWAVSLSAEGEAFVTTGTVHLHYTFEPSETWLLWGYDGSWVLLGGVGTREPPRVNERRQDLEAFGRWFGGRVLDLDVLGKDYGLPPRKPPADSVGWPTGDEAMDRLLRALRE